MKNLSTKVDASTYDEFIDSCNDSGETASERLRELVENDVNGSSNYIREPQIEYRDKEVIKEVIKEVPKIEYRDKIIKVPEIQTQYVDRPVEKIVEKRHEVAPNYLPSYNCSEGCTHQNKNYSKRVKSKCYNCDQFNKNETGKCSWCGSTDLNPIDKDELTDLGIPLPNYETQGILDISCPNSNTSCDYTRHQIA